MKKLPFKKPGQEQKSKRMSLRPTQSESNLNNIDLPQRKASTPKHDRSAATTSPDVSSISLLSNDTKADGFKGDGLENKNILPSKKPVKNSGTNAPKRADLQKTLDYEYTRYLQSVFKTKLMESRASNMDTELANLQKRIEKNQEVLRQTTQRLKNIKFNKEIDSLHTLNNPNYGKALESLDNSNCEAYLTTLHEKLEQSSNQLKVKNIQLPEGGAAQLLKVISETAEALENVKNVNDKEAWQVYKDAVETNQVVSNTMSRCKESIPEVEGLLLRRSTMKICNPDADDGNLDLEDLDRRSAD